MHNEFELQGESIALQRATSRMSRLKLICCYEHGVGSTPVFYGVAVFFPRSTLRRFYLLSQHTNVHHYPKLTAKSQDSENTNTSMPSNNHKQYNCVSQWQAFPLFRCDSQFLIYTDKLKYPWSCGGICNKQFTQMKAKCERKIFFCTKWKLHLSLNKLNLCADLKPKYRYKDEHTNLLVAVETVTWFLRIYVDDVCNSTSIVRDFRAKGF